MFVLRGEEGAELLFSPGPASAPDMAAREQRQQPAALQVDMAGGKITL